MSQSAARTRNWKISRCNRGVSEEKQKKKVKGESIQKGDEGNQTDGAEWGSWLISESGNSLDVALVGYEKRNVRDPSAAVMSAMVVNVHVPYHPPSIRE